MQITKKGFTMIELSFAMVFLSILALVIIMVILDAASSYRRGLTLNQINTVGMDLVNDIRLAIQASPARSLAKECTELDKDVCSCEGSGGTCSEKLVMAQQKGTIEIGDKEEEVPLYGTFCTGKYSYIWHSGYLFNDEVKVKSEDYMGGIALKYRIEGESEEKVINGEGEKKPRLLKLQDEERMVCRGMIDDSKGDDEGGDEGGDEGSEGGANVRLIKIGLISGEPIDLLESDDSSDLALYDLYSSIPVSAEVINSAFYSVSFILGTLKGGANVNANTNNCKPPEEVSSEFDYCAINKFNFAAQAIGG